MLRLLLVAGLALAWVAPFGASHAQATVSQKTSLDQVKSAVLAATGYDSEAVELTATKAQLVVTLVNSKLVDRPAAEREREASKIASTIAKTIANKADFTGIQAIHVDYVKREMKSGHTQAIDGIDFRKDPQGNFQHHVS